MAIVKIVPVFKGESDQNGFRKKHFWRYKLYYNWDSLTILSMKLKAIKTD